MAKAPTAGKSAALLVPETRTVHVCVVIPVALQEVSREKFDVVPEFMDYKIAKLGMPELIDQLGSVKRERKELEKWEKLAVDVLKGRMGSPTGGEIVASGVKYQAVLTGVARRALSKDKLVAKFGGEALEDCYEESIVETLNVKPLVI